MNTSRRSTRIEMARELHVRGQPLLKGKRIPTPYTVLKAPNFEPEGEHRVTESDWGETSLVSSFAAQH